ncbi:hypothetical protein NBRC116601_00320 [Cognatishimia sp. WU-CL00825]|uniref:hypothetical protein n=1 Tax=Cognatishimia sp. WU-CL00825 TaxID=3127658 RepID=UPI00310A4C92
MVEPSTVLEIIDYNSFPKPLSVGAVGMVYGKITNGMTTNFFSELIYPFHLDANGYPSIGIKFALDAIRYSATSEVLVAIQYLQGHGWFEREVEFFINGLDPFDEIQANGWKSERGSDEEWGTSERVDMAFYLEDVVSELEEEGKALSKEWYYAKVSQLYFSDIEMPDVAMTIGILLAQLWWRVDLGGVAERGQANSEALQKANSARKERSKVQSEDRNNVISQYWIEAMAEFGAETMRRDSNAAQAIYAIAMRKRPKELLIKATGEVIGVEAIRKRISALRKLNKVG